MTIAHRNNLEMSSMLQPRASRMPRNQRVLCALSFSNRGDKRWQLTIDPAAFIQRTVTVENGYRRRLPLAIDP